MPAESPASGSLKLSEDWRFEKLSFSQLSRLKVMFYVELFSTKTWGVKDLHASIFSSA